MCAMENEGLEETHPTQNNPETEEESGLDETRPRPLAKDEPTPVGDLGATMPTPVHAQETQSGFEETIPPPVGEQKPSQQDQAESPQPPAPPVGPKPAAGQTGKRKPKRRKLISWLLFSLLGLLIILLIATASAFGGYRSGISLRESAAGTEVARVAQEQYELGLQEMAQGQYSRARQRFEYVIQLDPNYPGVTEKLADVLLELNTTATPTLVPTPTLTPTPDLRSQQELYNQGKQYLADKAWDNAIDTLLSLRKNDPAYQTVDIDGMLFVALRNRGVEKIGKTDLEGGIYDLTLASRFGPLDTEAQAYLTWTTMYITGASFWEIDWEQVVSYFEQVAPQMPSLTDGSGMTATERLRRGLYEYGNVLANSGRYCQAVARYQQSLGIAYDPQVEAALNAASKPCQQKENPQQPQQPQQPQSP
jgi:tetratricopeptide (TPR) repeat protein